MSSDGEAAMTVRGHDGRERTANLRVADPAVRHALTEPERMFTGLGFRFWEPPAPPVLGLVEPGGPAARAGLMAGDRILAVNGEPVKLFRDLAEMIHARPAENIAVRYSRNGAGLTVRLVTDVVLNEGRREGRIRVAPAAAQLPANMIVRKEYGPFAALARATIDAWQMTALQARMFWRMLQGQVSLKNLSGPLSIAEFAGESARSGLTGFLGFLVLISLSLGFLNLLPIPILDGGQIVLQLAELVKGAPLSERAQLVGQQIGMALLLLLMGVALFNDVARQLG
jgi:regulator of sigma E protease